MQLTGGGLGGGGSLCIPCVITKVVAILVFCVVVFVGGDTKLRGVHKTCCVAAVVSFNIVIMNIFSCVCVFCAGDFVDGEHGGRVKVCGVLKVRGQRVTGILTVRAIFATFISVIKNVITKVLFSGLTLVLVCQVLKVRIAVRFSIPPSTIGGAILIFNVLCVVALFCGLVRVGLTGPIRLLQNDDIKRGRPGAG